MTVMAAASGSGLVLEIVETIGLGQA